MEEARERKQQIRDEIARKLENLGQQEVAAKTQAIEERLFDFANFLEARIAMLYTPAKWEVDTERIVKRAYEYNKLVVLPAFDAQTHKMTLMKVDNPDAELIQGPRGNLEPDPKKCKKVPVDCVDIAIVPGLAMDEKGGRIGSGQGYYDRFLPELPITTRKVGLVFEDQILQQVPMESHDKYVDIIITEKRIIYKI